ncbi:MAG: hypothetical protein HY748_07080 [Elusimicrobia bacterium]|nr:hypothetical protein [Elusimicrobiota bacterium]
MTKALNEGGDRDGTKTFSGILGLDPLVPTKRLKLPAEECDDHRLRLFDVQVQRSPETGRIIPVKAMLLVRKVEGPRSESAYLQLGLDGTLEKIKTASSRVDENGKYIRGSGKPTVLDPESAEAKALLQRELDFWLKGIGLKEKRKHSVNP